MRGIARTNRKIGQYLQKLSPSLRQIDGKNAAQADGVLSGSVSKFFGTLHSIFKTSTEVLKMQ